MPAGDEDFASGEGGRLTLTDPSSRPNVRFMPNEATMISLACQLLLIALGQADWLS
jgi:hypothetical protein